LKNESKEAWPDEVMRLRGDLTRITEPCDILKKAAGLLGLIPRILFTLWSKPPEFLRLKPGS